jgi:hypothetical protein
MLCEDGVAAGEGLQLLEDRFLGLAESVALDPLEPADPDGHLRQLVGVGVDLDAVKLPRTDLRQVAREAAVHRVENDLLLEVLQLLQHDVKQVAGAAGGIEHLHVLKAVQVVLELRVGLCGVGLLVSGRAQHGEVALIDEVVHRELNPARGCVREVRPDDEPLHV